MNRLLRILSHRGFERSDARRALAGGALARIEAAVTDSERRHSGEIRVCIEAGLPLSYLWRDAEARERALAMFGKLRVWDTAQNNGVLVYLLLAERRIEVVADRGVDARVGATEWTALVDSMGAAFHEGRFEAGLLAAIARVDALLVQHFALPGEGRNPNELPDAPVLIL